MEDHAVGRRHVHNRPLERERHDPVGLMRMAKMRKFLAAALLGLVELAAYVATDPRDLPSWVVTGALATNALAVYWVRNQPPKTVAPTLFARRPVRDDDLPLPHGHDRPPRPRE